MLYNPSLLLQKDLVFVSLNYRTGALGFLSLDDPSLDVPGNAGLKDQTLALKWIKDNIKNFGGDPDNVTLFGTSAGGASVHYHMISDKSKGLFHRAIPMSGTSLNMNWVLHPRRNYAERMARVCGYEGDGSEKSVLEFLEGAEFEKIVMASENILTDEVRILRMLI
jgi:cholinesterase